jgi:hypothetical protein
MAPQNPFDDLDNPTEPDYKWPTRIPLDGNTAELPAFPTHTLPAWVHNMAHEVADDLQVAVDLPAMLALGALSAITAGKAEIQIRNTWTEPANLYLVCALPPGAGKSPAFKAMIGPLEQYQTELRRTSETHIARIEQERRIITTQMKRAEDKGDIHEAQHLLNKLTQLPQPTRPRLIIDDATPEAVVARLHEQNGRLALMSSEGGLFDMITGRYTDKVNLDPYLQAWSGDTINVDRMGRPSLTIDKPLLTITLTVQPTIIERLATRPELAGRGLTARFMYAIPPDNVGHRQLNKPERTTSEIRTEYTTKLTNLAHKLASWDLPGRTQLNPTATQTFTTWRQTIENRRRANSDLYGMREWTTKLESSVARTALILHIADGNPTNLPIDNPTILRAIEIGNYWIDHARAVHGTWGASQVQTDALAIWNWITAHQLTEPLEREIWRHLRRRFEETRTRLDHAITFLTESGYVRRLYVTSPGDTKVTQGSTRAKPSKALQVRPDLAALYFTISPCHQEIEKNPIYLSISTPHKDFTPQGPNPGETGEMVTYKNDDHTESQDCVPF